MKKINLRGISEVLSENELKNVMGGNETADSCSGLAPLGSSCDGDCPDKFVWDSKTGMGKWVSQSCYKFVPSYGNGNGTCYCG